MKPLPTLLLVLTVATPLSAASEYAFAVTGDGPYPFNDRGRIVVDDARWRVDLDRTSDGPRPHDSVILENGDRVALNHENKTWYRMKPSRPILFKSSLFSFFPSTRASNIRIDLTAQRKRGSASSVAGPQSLLSFSYDISTEVFGERVRGDVWGTITVSTSEPSQPLARVPPLLDVKTGLDNVDETLHQALTSVRGAAWISELTVNRRIARGKTMTQVIRTTLSSARIAADRSLLFAVPDGYQYQEPVVGVPGT